MSTPINQIRSRSVASGQATQMVYDPVLQQVPPDPVQLGTTFPQSDQMISGQGFQQQQQMPGQSSNYNSGMIDDILQEMERSSVPESVGPDPNVGLINYAINPVNIPPPMNQQAKQQLLAESTQAVSTASTIPSVDINNDLDSSTLLGELSGNLLGQKIINSIKPLVYVFLIVLILSLHQTNRFIFSFFPQLLLENGQLSIYAILLRCSIAVILFYLLTLFI